MWIPLIFFLLCLHLWMMLWTLTCVNLFSHKEINDALFQIGPLKAPARFFHRIGTWSRRILFELPIICLISGLCQLVSVIQLLYLFQKWRILSHLLKFSGWSVRVLFLSVLEPSRKFWSGFFQFSVSFVHDFSFFLFIYFSVSFYLPFPNLFLFIFLDSRFQKLFPWF